VDDRGRSRISEQPSFAARRSIQRIVEAAIRSDRPVAVDSSALILFLEDHEPYAQLLVPLLDAGGAEILISSVTVAEALVHPARLGAVTVLELARQAILKIPGAITIPLDNVSAVQTAIVRARTGLKLPDAAIIAAAQIGNACALIGNDRFWKNRDLGVPYHHLDDILALE
jgi:hypothetical protein